MKINIFHNVKIRILLFLLIKHKGIHLNGNIEMKDLMKNSNNKEEKKKEINQLLEEAVLLLVLQDQLKYKGFFLLFY